MAFKGFSLDVNTFFDYWNTVKYRVNDLISAGSEILNLNSRYKDLESRAYRLDDAELIKETSEGLSRTNEQYSLWQQVKSNLDNWLVKWTQAEQSAVPEGQVPAEQIPEITQFWGYDGFGFAFILPAWAIGMLLAGGLAALTFVAIKGLELLKQIETERFLLSQVEQGVITAEQAQGMIAVGAQTASLFPDLSAGVSKLGSSISTTIEEVTQEIGSLGVWLGVALAGIVVYKFWGWKK